MRQGTLGRLVSKFHRRWRQWKKTRRMRDRRQEQVNRQAIPNPTITTPPPCHHPTDFLPPPPSPSPLLSLSLSSLQLFLSLSLSLYSLLLLFQADRPVAVLAVHSMLTFDPHASQQLAAHPQASVLLIIINSGCVYGMACVAWPVMT